MKIKLSSALDFNRDQFNIANKKLFSKKNVQQMPTLFNSDDKYRCFHAFVVQDIEALSLSHYIEKLVR